MRCGSPEILLAGLVVGAISSAIPIHWKMVALKAPSSSPGAFVMTSMEPAVAALLGLLGAERAAHRPAVAGHRVGDVRSGGSAATSQPTVHRRCCG